MQTHPHDNGFASEDDRLRRFGEDIDALKKRTFARVGAEDVAYVKRVDRISHGLEWTGRALIHFSLDPLTYFGGVFALALHKQLQTAEIGHSALHGAWDGLAGAERYDSKTFRWDAPIDEASWKSGHNVKHHGNTNVAGRDPDIRFGPARLTGDTPPSMLDRWALPFTLGILAPNFRFIINTHVTGFNDLYKDNGFAEHYDVLPDRSLKSAALALRRMLRKIVPYYAREYLFYPALAGPFFLKVLLGNRLAETASNFYTAATILCGHVGEDVKSWPVGTRARSRGEWYAMQVEGSCDYEVSLPFSILCGGLDRQIEHHLFPNLPPPRLREIAPEVKEICRRHGVTYRTDGWGRSLAKVWKRIGDFAREGRMRDALRAMTE